MSIQKFETVTFTWTMRSVFFYIMLDFSFSNRSCVRVVSSTRSGMGKSLYVKRMADQLRAHKAVGTVCVTIPLHGPTVSPDIVMEFLKEHLMDLHCTIFHFDIAPSVS